MSEERFEQYCCVVVCYGNQKKFKDIQRLFSIDQSNTLLGFSGEYSDVQHILKLLNGLESVGICWPPGTILFTAELEILFLRHPLPRKVQKKLLGIFHEFFTINATNLTLFGIKLRWLDLRTINRKHS